jgi:hypothetical protein
LLLLVLVVVVVVEVLVLVVLCRGEIDVYVTVAEITLHNKHYKQHWHLFSYLWRTEIFVERWTIETKARLVARASLQEPSEVEPAEFVSENHPHPI